MSTPERGDAGHAHRCSKEHRWQHSGPSAQGCALLARDQHNGVLSEADCAVCAGRDDLLTRPPHTHRCQFCDVEWVHEGRCVDGLAAWCPWDFPAIDGGTPTGARTGRHLHYCPDCGTHSPHHESCAAPFRLALPGCPGCAPGGYLKEAKRIGRKVRSSLRGEVWEVSRSRWLWGTIGGVPAAILLMSLGYPPVNVIRWRAPAEPPRVAVAPAPQPAVERLPPAPPALPAERRLSDPGEREPRVDEPAAPGPRAAAPSTSPPQATPPALVLPPAASGGLGSQTPELSPGSPRAPSMGARPPVPSGSVPCRPRPRVRRRRGCDPRPGSSARRGCPG